ncbi:hypothetical protein W822_12870 [Advenella kashmirensis W13003]|uniref:Uncharacterized protein n=2 Tax=Advenella kashmirensis TaxID=310575 RepID=V8QSP6_9BURK|nr:hypothetical protein W822_12870 [Advenella kashmirensis W13003]
MRGGLAVVAMLCIAGSQAAFVLAALCLAVKRKGAALRNTTGGQLLVGPNGFYRYWRNAVPASPKNAMETTMPADSGAVRILKRFWQGPFWLTLSLQDPYFPHTPADTVTVWSIGQPPDVWRRFRVLVLSARWVDTRSAGGRVAI